MRLARRGDRLVVLGADERRLGEVADAVGAVGGMAETHVLEVSDRRAVGDRIAEVIGSLGRITYLFVADTGAWRPGPLGEMATADWDLMIGSHLDVPFHICQAVLPHMVERRHGAIALGSPDPAVAEVGYGPGRAVARAALHALTKALALEFAALGVRVNAVGTGLIEGSLPSSGSADAGGARATQSAAAPMDRLTNAEDVASLVDFLLSDRASFITGQLLQPNGRRIMP